FGDTTGLTTSLLAAYERLTVELTGAAVTALPPLPEEKRQAVLEELTRRRAPIAGEIAVGYVAEDRMWAEWVAGLLVQIGYPAHIHLLGASSGAELVGDSHTRVVLVMSNEAARSAHTLTTGRALLETGRLLCLALI